MQILIAAFLLFASTAIAKVDQPSYWVATRGADKIYLLGTIHMRVSAEELPDEVWESLKKSNHVMIERNIVNDGGSPFVDYYEGMKSFHLRRTEKLTDAEYDFVNKDLHRRRHDLGTLTADDFSPIQLYKTWDHNESDLKFQLKNQTLDQQVAIRARKADVDLMELDKLVHTDVDSKDFISTKEFKQRLDERMKKGFVQSQADDETGVQAEVAAYRAGNCGQVTDAEYATMVTPRNREWMKVILKSVRAPKPLFIAVGCAHMDEAKPTGLVNLLKAQGFTVQKYKTPEIPQPSKNAPVPAASVAPKAP